jgi:hypothetical protein
MSRGSWWTARITCGLGVLFLVFSASMKFVPVPDVEQTLAHLGLPSSMRTPLGLLEFACTLVYAVPRLRVPRSATMSTILSVGYSCMSLAVCPGAARSSSSAVFVLRCCVPIGVASML